MGAVRGLIKTRIGTSLEKSVSLGTKHAKKICRDLAAADIASLTWKAICRRGGIFSNYKKEYFDWNDTFLKPFIKPLALSWKDVFNNDISRLHDIYSKDLNDALKHFSDRLKNSVAIICGHNYPPATGIFGKTPYLQDRTCRKVLDARRDAQKTAQEINRAIKNNINEHMQPVYEKCEQESGKWTHVIFILEGLQI
jgi:hypothetical protein